jgi:nicotinamidase-related amidase
VSPGADRHVAPEFAASALVTIDVQRDVLDGQPLEIAGTSAALPRMRELTAAFREAQRPIVHVVRLYHPDASNVDLCRRAAIEAGARFLVPGEPGSQVAPELLPRQGIELDADLLLSGRAQEIAPHEVVVYKPRCGAFFQTPLEEHLRSLAVTTVVFCGCNFPNCPRTSIYEASERDFRVVVASDALSGIYDRGVRELANIGVEVMATADVTAAVAQREKGPKALCL